MCTSKPGYKFNNEISLAQAQKYGNRHNSVLPTARGKIDEEVYKDPIRILTDPAFANEKLPKRDT